MILSRADIIAQLITFLGDKDMLKYVPAMRCIGNLLTTNEIDKIELMLEYNLLEKLNSLLHSTSSHIVKECCWALSNIAAGPPEHN
jgi:hypothetical protein